MWWCRRLGPRRLECLSHRRLESTGCWGARDRRNAMGRVTTSSCQCSGTAACPHYARGIWGWCRLCLPDWCVRSVPGLQKQWRKYRRSRGGGLKEECQQSRRVRSVCKPCSRLVLAAWLVCLCCNNLSQISWLAKPSYSPRTVLGFHCPFLQQGCHNLYELH